MLTATADNTVDHTVDHTATPTNRPHLKLYEATDALEIVRDFLAESEGELTPAIEELLNQATDDFDAKAERVALMVREFLATAEAIDHEAERLAARARAAGRSAESLKAYLYRNMKAAGRETIKRPLVTIAIQRSSTPTVTVPNYSEETLRDFATHSPELVKRTPETFAIDKRAVAAAWKAGTEIPPGTTVTIGDSLRIK